MATDNDNLHLKRAQQVLAETDRDSYGIVRILSDSAGRAGEEREYEPGDEALVESGRAEWVTAPVHLPSSGRRLDHDAEREQTPQDGVEVYPPAEPTTPQRRSEARIEGFVDAHSDEGLGEKLATARADIARDNTGAGDKGDAKTQAALGGLAARSGPVTNSANDLTAEKLVGDQTGDQTGDRSGDRTGGDRSGDRVQVSEGSAVKSAAAKKTAAADKSDVKASEK